jgi:Ca-activated chloride channel family protein
LVAFAGSAFLQAPLTLDHGAVLTAVDELDTAVIPKGGTNLDAAISTADEAFGKAEGFSRAIVIVSDGEELSADGVAAARNASRQGVRIFTVGVGSPEGSEIPDGIGEFIRDPDTSKVVTSKLDEARMKEIAEATGGFYTRLDDGAAALIATEGIGKMAESDITANSSRRPIERYQWPLGAAIALLMLQSLVGERRRRPIAAAIAAFVLLSPAAWAGPAGIEAYDQGDFEKAREAFESRLRMEPESPGLQLNAGTAAYRLKDYAKASQYFSRASLSDDAAIRSAAEYNFANTLFRQGEGQQDKEKKITDWKEAIAKYDAALKTRPDYEEAKENKERVEQLLKELEKEQKQEKQDQQQENDQKQDQQQKNQDQQQQQQKDQDQKQDQQKQDQKDQQQQDQNQQQQQGGGQQDQEQKEEQNKQNQSGSGSGSGQEKKDQQNQEQKENKQDEQQQEGQNKDQEQKDSQQKKDQQPGGQGQQDQEKKDGGQGEGEKKDDQQQQGGQKEGEQKDQENKQDKQDQGAQQKEQEKSGGEPGEEKKDEGREDGKEEQKPSPTGDSRPQSGQSGDERGPVPQQSQEKKEGEVRGAGQPQGGKEEEGGTPAAALEEEEDGKMNESQARALLRALQNEEGKVDLLEREVFQDVSKDW